MTKRADTTEKRFEALVTFDGYPLGARETFAKGEIYSLPADYVDMLVAKGHAKEIDAE